MRNTLAAIAAAALGTAGIIGSPAAYASSAPAAATQTVNFGDIDMSTSDGQREFDRRVARAARAVCPESYVTGTRIDGRQRCMSQVRRQAFEQVQGKAGRIGLGG